MQLCSESDLFTDLTENVWMVFLLWWGGFPPYQQADLLCLSAAVRSLVLI